MSPCFFRSSFLLSSLSLIGVCCGGPTAPSGDASVVVRVIDEATSLPIVDPAFGISVKLTGPATYTRTVSGGTASFSSVVSGTYSLTTEFTYGYRQLDLISIIIDRPQTFTLPMLPVDDLGLTEVLVDGQGSIPKGGSINVAADGVTLTFRGRYQLVKYPRPSLLGFLADPFSAPFEYGTAASYVTAPPSDTQWEFTMSRWVPCLGGSVNLTCVTASESILLRLNDPRARAGAGTTIMSRLQSWPITYRLAPDCCRYPL